MRPDYTTRSSGDILSVVASTATIVAFLVLPMIARALSCAPRVFTLSEAYETRKELPVAVLRLETRSTQLLAVLKSYQACYEGIER